MNIEELSPNEFPALLKEINDPPKKLFVQGALPKEGNKILCVVGARKYTEYGKEVTEKLIAGLRGYPITIISGLALGIDGIAHRTALESNLQTIAVPGSGLDPSVLYPSSHKQLAEKIIEAGGGLITEFEPNFHATIWSFPQRNRIMAGLSHAVLVIEAEQKSGTLITSKLATEYNRDVFTVPGSIFSKTSAGPHMLIRLGATPITSSTDLLTALGFSTEEEMLPPEEKYKECSAEEMEIIKLLTEPLTRDDLMRALGKPIGEAQGLISIMEIKGIIEERMGEIRLI